MLSNEVGQQSRGSTAGFTTPELHLLIRAASQTAPGQELHRHLKLRLSIRSTGALLEKKNSMWHSTASSKEDASCAFQAAEQMDHLRWLLSGLRTLCNPLPSDARLGEGKEGILACKWLCLFFPSYLPANMTSFLSLHSSLLLSDLFLFHPSDLFYLLPSSFSNLLRHFPPIQNWFSATTRELLHKQVLSKIHIQSHLLPCKLLEHSPFESTFCGIKWEWWIYKNE